MTPDQRYSEIVNTFMRCPGVTQQGRGFGSLALRVRGKMFATLSSSGTLVVKLPRHRVDALVAAGLGTPFEPAPGRGLNWARRPDRTGCPWPKRP